MKILKNIALLALVWIGSNLALSITFLITTDEKISGVEDYAGSTLYIMIFSLIFSLPAFLFFLTFSMITLATKWSTLKKRLFMVLINYIDIIGTFLILFLLITADDKSGSSVGDHLGFFTRVEASPLWVLIATSTLLILIMPFQFTTNQK